MKLVIALVLAFLVFSQSRVLISNHMAPNCTAASETFLYVAEDKKCSVGPDGFGYGTISCTANNTFTSQNCADNRCQRCQQPFTRPLGCVSFQGQSLRIACGNAPTMGPSDFTVTNYHVSNGDCSGTVNLEAVVRARCYSWQNASARVFCDTTSGLVRIQTFGAASCAGVPTYNSTRTVDVCYPSNNQIPTGHKFGHCRRGVALSNLNFPIVNVKNERSIFPKGDILKLLNKF